MVAGTNPGRSATDPRIAVLIPCHDDGEYVADAVASVREDEPVEIVVVNDGSADRATLDVLARLEETGVRVLHHEQPRGVSAARMAAFEATSAPFVFPLDADDMLLEGSLGAMAARLEESGAAVCWGDYVELRPKRLLFRAVPGQMDAYRLAFTNEFPVSALFRRTTLESVGGWQPLGLEYDLRSDWSLWMTLAEKGIRGVHLGPRRAAYIRRMHPGRLTAMATGRGRELRAALKAAHPQTFDHLRRHRESSDLQGARRALFPLVYGMRVPGLDRKVKAALDRAGVWTLQHEMDEASRAHVLGSARSARHAGGELVGRSRPKRGGAGADHPPIIIIGSGRSGTAYVTRVLEGLGIFMGSRQDTNAEAFHFIRVNTALLSRASISWSSPELFQWRLEDPEFRNDALAFAESRLSSP